MRNGRLWMELSELSIGQNLNFKGVFLKLIANSANPKTFRSRWALISNICHKTQHPEDISGSDFTAADLSLILQKKAYFSYAWDDSKKNIQRPSLNVNWLSSAHVYYPIIHIILYQIDKIFICITLY